MQSYPLVPSDLIGRSSREVIKLAAVREQTACEVLLVVRACLLVSHQCFHPLPVILELLALLIA